MMQPLERLGQSFPDVLSFRMKGIFPLFSLFSSSPVSFLGSDSEGSKAYHKIAIMPQ